jgi:hypothetical protein
VVNVTHFCINKILTVAFSILLVRFENSYEYEQKMSGINYSDIYVYLEVQYPTLSKNANCFCRAHRSLPVVNSGEFSTELLQSNAAFAGILIAVKYTACLAGNLNCVMCGQITVR